MLADAQSRIEERGGTVREIPGRVLVPLLENASLDDELHDRRVAFLTLSLTSMLAWRTLSFDRFRMVINYGLNRVRFISPVPAGSRVRARFSPVAVEEAGGGMQVTWAVTFERESVDKPAASPNGSSGTTKRVLDNAAVWRIPDVGRASHPGGHHSKEV